MCRTTNLYIKKLVVHLSLTHKFVSGDLRILPPQPTVPDTLASETAECLLVVTPLDAGESVDDQSPYPVLKMVIDGHNNEVTKKFFETLHGRHHQSKD